MRLSGNLSFDTAGCEGVGSHHAELGWWFAFIPALMRALWDYIAVQRESAKAFSALPESLRHSLLPRVSLQVCRVPGLERTSTQRFSRTELCPGKVVPHAN